MDPATTAVQAQRERRLFLFIVVFLFPILTLLTVCAYGFAVWIWQIWMGPPV